MERCKACGEAVPVSSNRRTINAGTSKSVLVSISKKISFPEAALHFGSGYLCNNCFKLAGRHERLRSELMNVEKQLKRTLQFVLTSQSNDAGLSRAAKRPLRGETLPKQKRARIEVNEGDVLVSTEWCITYLRACINLSDCI